MKQPDPPFLELSFYFDAIADPDAISTIAQASINLGAKFLGHVTAIKGPAIRSEPFAGISDDPFPKEYLIDPSEISNLLEDPNVRVMQLSVVGAAGIDSVSPEIITYLSVSPKAAQSDHHPVSIWTGGEFFSGGLAKERQDQLLAMGMQVYDRFRSIVRLVLPSFASITGSIPLQCPSDLRTDPKTDAFRDFYIGEQYLGISKMLKVREIFHDAYIEDMQHGIYVSSSREFNPTNISMSYDEAFHRSIQVAKLIALGTNPGQGQPNS